LSRLGFGAGQLDLGDAGLQAVSDGRQR